MAKSEYNDPARFAQWVESQRPRLITMIESKIGNQLRRKLEVEDLLQDATGRAVQSLESADFSGGDPMPWFLQVIEHQIIDAHRFHFGAQKRDASREISANTPAETGESGHSPELIDLLVASMTSPSQAFSKHVRLDRMHRALESLSQEARQAIQWRYLENLPSQEIASRLGKTDGAIRVLLTRTLKKLQEMLQDPS